MADINIFDECAEQWIGTANRDAYTNKLRKVSLAIVKLLAENGVMYNDLETIRKMCLSIMSIEVWKRPDTSAEAKLSEENLTHYLPEENDPSGENP